MPESPNLPPHPALEQQLQALRMTEGPDRDSAIQESNERLLIISRTIVEAVVEPASSCQQRSLEQRLADQLMAFKASQQARSEDDYNTAHTAGQLLDSVNEQLLGALNGNSNASSVIKHPEEK